MGIAANQEVQNKPAEKTEWSFRRLLSFGSIANLTKVFTSPFEVMLGFLVIVIGIAELLGRRVSWFMWIFIILVLLAALYERNKTAVEEKVKSKSKPNSNAK